MTMTDNINTPEEIALRYSCRGMTGVRSSLAEGYFSEAARKLLSCPKGNVLLTTGFYVAGAAETDGPPGILCLAMTLHSSGYTPIILTDEFCCGLFEPWLFPVEYAPINAPESYFAALLDRYVPVALISSERCGRNRRGDYSNSLGQSIASYTAPIDRIFDLAAERNIFTIGIGDGGNEIGMGNVQEDVLRYTVLSPCVVPVSALLIATVSNWGAYALCAALCRLAPARMPEYEVIRRYFLFLAEKGCVDGITRCPSNTADGFPEEIEQEIYSDLYALSLSGVKESCPQTILPPGESSIYSAN